MLFFDPKTKTIANIHSGWRGTYQEIGKKTVQKMKEELKVEPKNLICCMCPSIGKCHFEVRKDIKEIFWEKFKETEEIEKIIERNKETEEEKWNIDTILLNKKILYKQGIKPENVIESKICTVCHNKILHSYRSDKKEYGLETAIITLKESKNV